MSILVLYLVYRQLLFCAQSKSLPQEINVLGIWQCDFHSTKWFQALAFQSILLRRTKALTYPNQDGKNKYQSVRYRQWSMQIKYVYINN